MNSKVKFEEIIQQFFVNASADFWINKQCIDIVLKITLPHIINSLAKSRSNIANFMTAYRKQAKFMNICDRANIFY